MNRLQKTICGITVLMAGMAMAAAPASVTFTDCVLRADISPSARATPGLGGNTSMNLTGTATFRNDSDQPLVIKSALIHVKDGYDKALFDLGPYNIPTIPPKQMRSISMSYYYPGAVSVFRFSSDLVITAPGGPDTTLSLTPQSQAAPGKSTGSNKVPGY